MRHKLVRKHSIDDGDIFIFDLLDDTAKVENLHQALIRADVSILGCSNEKSNKFREIMFDLDEKDFSSTNLGKSILNSISDAFGKKYICYKVLGNYLRFGCNTFTHQDCENPDVISALYFVNSKWHHDWGGEVMFFDSSKDSKVCISVKPGRLVLFNANIYHRAGVPQRPCKETRVTISARYNYQ